MRSGQPSGNRGSFSSWRKVLWRSVAERMAQPVEHAGDPGAAERGVDLDPQALAGVVVVHREQSQGAAVDHPVVHEVHAPAFVLALRRRRLPLTSHQVLFAAVTTTHLQAFLPVDPVDALVVVVDTSRRSSTSKRR